MGRLGAELQFCVALRAVSLRCVKPRKAKPCAVNIYRVAVDDIDIVSADLLWAATLTECLEYREQQARHV